MQVYSSKSARDTQAQTKENPVTSCRLILPDTAATDLYDRLRNIKKIQIALVSEATNTDIRIVDVRSKVPATIDPLLPTLLVVDPSNIPVEFDKTLHAFKATNIEIITDSELESPTLLLRVQLLQSRIKHTVTDTITGDIVRENAYTILQSVMRESNDWMVLKGLDNTFLLASGYACKSFQLSESEIIGKNDLEIGTPEELVLGKPETNWTGFWELDKRLTDNGDSAVIEPLALPNVEHPTFGESTTKLSLKDRYGKVFALLVTISSVTLEKRASDASTRSLSSIWAKKRILNKSPAMLEMQKEKHLLELEKEATENAYIQKNQFVAAASHDIRQPLHALGLFIHALHKKIDNPETLSILDKIKRCHESISELLNSLLDISRLDANAVSTHLTHFKIDKLLNRLRDEQIEKATSKSIDFHVSSDQSIAHCDEVLVERILRNLITNALNYTVEGSVSVHAQREGAQINIHVSDTGPGIPERNKSAIFLEYYRIEGESAKGFGLGLPIVKRLCKLLEVDLDLESTVGVGTQFKISVPLGDTEKQFTRTRPMPPKFNSKPSVLIVDDDHRVLSAVEVVLEQHGCLVTTAESEQQLTKKIKAGNIQADLLLIDYQLGDKVTGLQALKSINATLGQQIPAIVITGDTSAEGLREINENGLMVLRKPVLATTLLSAVNEILSITL